MRKSIYFKNEIVLQHVQNQPNSSDYIEKLVLKDMENKSNDSITKTDLEKLFNKYLSNLNLSKINSKKNTDYNKLSKSVLNLTNMN